MSKSVHHLAFLWSYWAASIAFPLMFPLLLLTLSITFLVLLELPIAFQYWSLNVLSAVPVQNVVRGEGKDMVFITLRMCLLPLSPLNLVCLGRCCGPALLALYGLCLGSHPALRLQLCHLY